MPYSPVAPEMAIDLADTTAEAAYRADLRAWLVEHVPAAPVPADPADRHAFLLAWHRQLHRGGWLGLSWPAAYGGRGLGPIEEAIFNQELGASGAPPAPPLLNAIGRAIMLFGSEAQRQRYLPAMLAAEELWCQGFSEPGAGSDLAGLQTWARLDGDVFVVTGQKVWTSYAQFSDFCLLLVRTGEERHQGLSTLIVDLHSPGISVRPIRQITGDEEFTEVFFDETPVPAANLVGGLGDGWRLAMANLAYDRGPVDIGFQAKYLRLVSELQDVVESSGRAADPAVRSAVAEAAIHVEVLRLQTLRSLSRRARGEAPGPEGSIDKLLMARTEQALLHLALDIIGPAALERTGPGDPWFGAYLYSRAATIYGGTAQIQRNILAGRILGLPA